MIASRPLASLMGLCLLALADTGFAAAADAPVSAPPTSEEVRRMTELRNTVVNLLQALVERGVLSKDQAESLVRDAQSKAAAEASAQAAQDKAEAGAVRVPYVPQIVRDEIRKEVLAELGPTVTKEVIEEAKSAGSLAAALPDWVRNVQLFGDVRMRIQDDLYSRDNATNTYLNFAAVNTAGGVGKAGTSALLDTAVDHQYLRERLRFGFAASLGDGWSAVMRIATGNLQTPVSTNQTLGTYDEGYSIGVDQGYLRWEGATASKRQALSVTGGRMPNPFDSTELVFWPDLEFEGASAHYRLSLSPEEPSLRGLYATVGAFPLQHFQLAYRADDKWLIAGQLGLDLRNEAGARVRLGVAYYDYLHVAGLRNSPASTLFNYTAPTFVQKGNTLFDISNSTDPTVNLFALAADFRELDVTGGIEWPVLAGYVVGVNGDYVDNIGYNEARILARTGQSIAPRTRGYLGQFTFGRPDLNVAGAWRGTIGYRFIERDAVIDAFNDPDFHLGGTDAKGYSIVFDYAINPHVYARVRYLSANEIDGPPLGIDVLQLDVVGHF